MLRVGLTGGLGSGKSTVAAMLRARGAAVLEADGVGRAMMEPGEPVFKAIVAHFGREVLDAAWRLGRKLLEEMAFAGGRLDELNAIVHPPVLAAQKRWMEEVFGRDPAAVAVIESALIFEVVRDARARGETGSLLADWRRRIDRVVVVTAPDWMKIERYAARVSPAPEGRVAAEADARMRIARQIPDVEKAAKADFVIDNSGDRAALERQVEAVWQRLKSESNKIPATRSLE